MWFEGNFVGLLTSSDIDTFTQHVNEMHGSWSTSFASHWTDLCKMGVKAFGKVVPLWPAFIVDAFDIQQIRTLLLESPNRTHLQPMHTLVSKIIKDVESTPNLKLDEFSGDFVAQWTALKTAADHGKLTVAVSAGSAGLHGSMCHIS